MSLALPVQPAHELDARPDTPRWLIEGLWADEAVGIVGGASPNPARAFSSLIWPSPSLPARLVFATFPSHTLDAFSSTPQRMRFRLCAEDSKVSAISTISTSHNSIFRLLLLHRYDSTRARIKTGCGKQSPSFDQGSCSSTLSFVSTVSTRTRHPMSPPFSLTSANSNVCSTSPLSLYTTPEKLRTTFALARRCAEAPSFMLGVIPISTSSARPIISRSPSSTAPPPASTTCL